MTYEEIKKELARLKEEKDNNCTTYELYYPSNGGAPYYTNVFDSEKWGAIVDKMYELSHLPEYIEGKKVEDKKNKLRLKAESYRRQLEELNEIKAYIEEWFAEYEARGEI